MGLVVLILSISSDFCRLYERSVDRISLSNDFRLSKNKLRNVLFFRFIPTFAKLPLCRWHCLPSQCEVVSPVLFMIFISLVYRFCHVFIIYVFVHFQYNFWSHLFIKTIKSTLGPFVLVSSVRCLVPPPCMYPMVWYWYLLLTPVATVESKSFWSNSGRYIQFGW